MTAARNGLRPDQVQDERRGDAVEEKRPKKPVAKSMMVACPEYPKSS
jgi:hypothetical protein